MINLQNKLEEFDEKFLAFRNPNIIAGGARDEIKLFLSKSIKEALESVVPKEDVFSVGWDDCRQELLNNIQTYLK